MCYDWIEPHLHPGEQIIWAGRPEKGPLPNRYMQRWTLGFFTAHTLLFLWIGAASGQWGTCLLLWTVLTVLEGCMLLLICLTTARHIRRDLYVITDRRLVFLMLRRRENGCRLYWEMDRRYISSVRLSAENDRLASVCVNPLLKHAPNTLYCLPNAEAIRALLLTDAGRA